MLSDKKLKLFSLLLVFCLAIGESRQDSDSDSASNENYESSEAKEQNGQRKPYQNNKDQTGNTNSGQISNGFNPNNGQTRFVQNPNQNLAQNGFNPNSGVTAFRANNAQNRFNAQIPNQNRLNANSGQTNSNFGQSGLNSNTRSGMNRRIRKQNRRNPIPPPPNTNSMTNE